MSTVLWAILEGSLGDVAPRLMEFGADPDQIIVADRLPDGLASIEKIVRETTPALVVVDTLAALVEGVIHDHQGDSAGWTKVFNHLGRIARDYRCAILVNHHARKSDGKYRDSSAIGAGADVIIELHELEADPSVRVLEPKARWKMERFTVRLHGTGYHLLSGSPSLEERIITFLRNTPGSGTTKVRKAVGSKAAEVDNELRKLLASGAIVDRGEATGHKYYLAPTVSNALADAREEQTRPGYLDKEEDQIGKLKRDSSGTGGGQALGQVAVPAQNHRGRNRDRSELETGGTTADDEVFSVHIPEDYYRPPWAKPPRT